MQHQDVTSPDGECGTDCLLTREMALLDFERARDVMMGHLRFWLLTRPPFKQVDHEIDAVLAGIKETLNS